jgi:predicted 2-oxoglutarate/Fe(II)-dependent dioxygenase YbiX
MGLMAGAPAPEFTAPSPRNPRFSLNLLAGRYILLAFLPPPGPEREAALQLVRQNSGLFAPDKRLFFGVLPDEASFAEARDVPPLRWFGDASGELRRLFEATGPDGEVAPQWVLIDPTMRILGSAALADGPAMLARLAELGEPEAHAGVPLTAPVLIVPRVFEPAVCRQLIELYQAQGGQLSGVMNEKDGKTFREFNNYKKRRDVHIADADLRNELEMRIYRRLLPEIEKAYCFRATRIERHLIACYDAVEGGYFRPHRDNTTGGTAHRRFAVSINLNAEEFEGGDLRFPEFGQKTYRPPTGGAVVFSCSLLHEATPVTRGTRYAFLPFLYDEAAAEIRKANRGSLVAEPPP